MTIPSPLLYLQIEVANRKGHLLCLESYRVFLSGKIQVQISVLEAKEMKEFLRIQLNSCRHSERAPEEAVELEYFRREIVLR